MLCLRDLKKNKRRYLARELVITIHNLPFTASYRVLYKLIISLLITLWYYTCFGNEKPKNLNFISYHLNLHINIKTILTIWARRYIKSNTYTNRGCSSGVERLLCKQDVGGSIPFISTNSIKFSRNYSQGYLFRTIS